MLVSALGLATGITRTVEWYKAVDGGADPIEITRAQTDEYEKASR